MCWNRKEELAIGFTTPAGAQALLDKYRSVDVEHNMLKYVVEGRAAMGPSFLKVCLAAALRVFYCPEQTPPRLLSTHWPLGGWKGRLNVGHVTIRAGC